MVVTHCFEEPMPDKAVDSCYKDTLAVTRYPESLINELAVWIGDWISGFNFNPLEGDIRRLWP